MAYYFSDPNSNRRDGKIIVHVFVASCAALVGLATALFEPATLRLICWVLVVGNIAAAAVTYALSPRNTFGRFRG